MKPRMLARLVILLACGITGARADNLLKNSDLSSGLAGWHGDGEVVYVHNDGTEGQQGDQGVSPAIKLSLSRRDSRVVYQEFEARDKPQGLLYQVNILPASNFQPSTSKEDYTVELLAQTPGSYFHWPVLGVAKADFWIRAGPDWFYSLAAAVPGHWTMVQQKDSNPNDEAQRSVYFCVPPGTGALYLKDAAVTP